MNGKESNMATNGNDSYFYGNCHTAVTLFIENDSHRIVPHPCIAVTVQKILGKILSLA